MKKHKRIYSVLPLFIIFLITGCSTFAGKSAKTPPPQNALAVIGDRIITLPGFKERCDNLALKDSKMRDSSQRKKYLDMLVQMALFALDARDMDLDKEKQVVAKIDDTIDWILYKEYFQREIISNVNITDAQVKEYYDANHDEFKTVEKVKASHILIKVYSASGPAGLAKAKTRAEKLKQMLDKGADFAALARQNSDDSATRKMGGSLGYIVKEKMKISPEFMDAAFSLKAGEISNLVESPYGFHIIKADARIPEQVRPLDKVKTYIKSKLEKEKQTKLVEEITARLKGKYEVVVKGDALDW